MKSNFLKSALALLLCLMMVLLPSVTALAADIPALNLDENGGYTAPAENAPESEEPSEPQGEQPAEENKMLAPAAGNTVSVSFNVSPEGAMVLVTDGSKERILDEGGAFPLIKGQTYTCIVTASGYVSQSISYTAEADETVSVTLERAPETSFKKLFAEWPSFRYDSNNNGVISAKTPTTANDAVLYWAKKIGDGYGTGAASSPIIVDNYIYCYASTNLFKVDKISGEIVASAKMVANSAFAIVPPTYADGMLFVGLNNGRIQAFNADTLESLWIYKDIRGGQPNCPITYDNGYIYTGFWSGETKTCNYVCISVTDEDPNDQKEAKLATWTYAKQGGYYWAEAYIGENYLFIGTDDGKSGYVTGHASLLSLDKRTGKLADSLTMPYPGDIRCCITHDNGKLYFTSKGGYFYSVEVNETTGDILEGTLRSLQLDNYHNILKNPPMSTSTPTVYNGRAYVGVSGISQFGMYSGHNITVIDLNEWKIAYSVPTQGYPQTSAVLTTAYDKGDGSVYIYMFDNFTPGKLRVLCDRPGAAEPVNGTNTENYYNPSNGNTETYQTPQVLFTPYDAQAQYCICTPVVDADGFVYFKNDSAYLMVLGCQIEKLEVAKNPDKTSYKVGETFDATGMQVIAHYSNGAKKDVTKYLTWSTAPLTKDDTEFQVRFEHVKYQDKDGVPGTVVAPPYATIKISVRGETASGMPILDLEEENETRRGLISFNDTVKFNESDGVLFVNKPAGGTFYVAVLSDVEMTDVQAKVSGMVTAEIVNYDPEKYKSVGELYSVYDKRLESSGEHPVVEADMTYAAAKELAEKRNKEGKTTLNIVKCQSYVYVLKFKVDQNYTTAYKSGTYTVIGKRDGKTYTCGTKTVVSDVSIFNYEGVKCAALYGDALAIGDSDGYSDFLTAKYGYKYEEAYKGQTATVVSSTAFRAIAGKAFSVTCGENVTVTIPSVAANQRGVNFIYNCPEVTKTSSDSSTSTAAKKKVTHSLSFYGNQIIESDYSIKWDLGCTYAELLNIYKVRVEENDIITYYIYKNGQYFDKFTVDYMTVDYNENVAVTLKGEAGTPLGNYTISVTPPAAESTANSGEVNPNTGAFVPSNMR